MLGVATGKARVRFGGDKGKTIALRAGDFVVLPAGTGHQALSASKDLVVVGAHPPRESMETAAIRNQWLSQVQSQVIFGAPESHGGKKSGSGRGKKESHASSRKGGKLGGRAAATLVHMKPHQ